MIGKNRRNKYFTEVCDDTTDLLIIVSPDCIYLVNNFLTPYVIARMR